MPYIPLLPTPTQVARPDVPALDREQRPTIKGGAILSGMDAIGRGMAQLGEANKKPLVNPEPFVDAAGAVGHALGHALKTAGDAIGALAIKRQEAFDEEQVQRLH